MKNIPTPFLLLFLLALSLPHFAFAQDNILQEPTFEVNRIYSYVTITKAELQEAKSLSELNKQYKSEWIRTYIEVEISASVDGQVKKAISKNHLLSPAQKDLMTKADAETNIAVKIHYLPENTLSHNDPKEINFTLTLQPDCDAEFPGGQKQLHQYLQENLMAKIPPGSFQQYELAAVKFTISKTGKITNAHVFEEAALVNKNNTVDQLLLSTLRNMPDWKPAEYAPGIAIPQELVLTVGNMESCVINLLNIRRDGRPGKG